jgi:putative Mn2+ efflux pump MntP
MSFYEIVLLGLALSMDAAAVAAAAGAAMRGFDIRGALKMGLFFGGFQALMPVLGWAGGTVFASRIGVFAPWAAFGILVFVGGKMIWESFKAEKDSAPKDYCADGALLMLALATSMDALAVGVSFSLLRVAAPGPALLIGAITFLVSFVSVWAGSRLGKILDGKAEAAGGIVLIGIGVKILVEPGLCNR